MEPSGLKVRNGPMHARVRVKIPTLFGLEELGPNRHRRPVVAEPSHDIAGPRLMRLPAISQKSRGDVEPIAPTWDLFKPIERELRVVPSHMKVLHTIGARHFLPVVLEGDLGKLSLDYVRINRGEGFSNGPMTAAESTLWFRHFRQLPQAADDDAPHARLVGAKICGI